MTCTTTIPRMGDLAKSDLAKSDLVNSDLVNLIALGATISSQKTVGFVARAEYRD